MIDSLQSTISRAASRRSSLLSSLFIFAPTPSISAVTVDHMVISATARDRKRHKRYNMRVGESNKAATQKISLLAELANQLREVSSRLSALPTPHKLHPTRPHTAAIHCSLSNAARQNDLQSKIDVVQTRIDAVESKQERVESALEGNGPSLGTTDHVSRRDHWMIPHLCTPQQ